MHRRFAALAVAAMFVTSAMAQEERPLTDLAACRLDAEEVVLSFKFDASPCWEAGEPRFDETEGDRAAVTVPTVQVGQICTMNIVVYEYSEVLPLMASINRLGVTINDPEGRLIGQGTAAIAEPGGDCEKPAEAAE